MWLNENRLSVHVLCVCVFMLLMVMVRSQIEVVQMGAIWRCAERKCGEVEEAHLVTCGHL